MKGGAGPHDLGPGGCNNKGSPPEVQCSPDSSSGIAPSLFYDSGDDDRSSMTSIDSESDIVSHNTAPVRSFPRLPAFARSDLCSIG